MFDYKISDVHVLVITMKDTVVNYSTSCLDKDVAISQSRLTFNFYCVFDDGRHNVKIHIKNNNYFLKIQGWYDNHEIPLIFFTTKDGSKVIFKCNPDISTVIYIELLMEI